MPQPARPPETFEPPYAAGWFDRLTAWIDRMPGPNALYCVGLLLLQLVYMKGLLWLNGTVPVGEVDLRLVFVVVVAPYLLWARFYLDRVAAAALDTFRPVLIVSEADFQRLRYELTTLPSRSTLIVTGMALAAFLLNLAFGAHVAVDDFGPSFAWGFVVLAPVGLFAIAVVAVATFQTIQQLRTVERIYGLVGKIDILRAKPLYAFSQLTARIGVSMLMLTYYVAAIRPDLVSSSPALEVLLVAMVPTAVACFVLPLRGMHRRLAAEKDRALSQVASRFEAAFAQLHQRVDQKDVSDADKLNAQIASLIAERDVLERVSTWPWEPATLTGFVTTLFLPVFLWGVQRVLERIGF